jgi:charged multivesicular body protein 7
MSELLLFVLAHEEAFKSKSRLASLYADFSTQRNINPEGYQANLSAWKQALSNAARAGVIPSQGTTHDLLSIRTGEDLARSLAHTQFGRPTCLPAVFEDAVSKKEMIPLKEFLSLKTSIYKSTWTISPLNVVKWGLRQLGVLGEPGSPQKLGIGNFVVLHNVEIAASLILKQVSGKAGADLVYSRTRFIDEFGTVLNPDSPISQLDLEVLLTYLARDKQAISFDKTAVKFKSNNNADPEPITEGDLAIVNLRDAIANLNNQITALEKTVAESDSAARSAVNAKHMVAAKGFLRAKKRAEAALANYRANLIQLDDLDLKIQQAHNQVQIVEAIKGSTLVLKGLHQQVGGAQGVEDVVEALREQMSQSEDISTIINEPGQVLDETEIDEEFAALEKAEEDKKVQKEQEEDVKKVEQLSQLEEASQRLKDLDEPEVLQASQEFSNLSFHQDDPSETEDEAEAEKKEKIPMAA